MSPVSPIPNLPPVPMPAGVRPVGQEKRRDPAHDPKNDDREETGHAAAGPPPVDAGRDGDPIRTPDEPGQIIDIKA